MRIAICVAVVLLAGSIQAQWTMLDAHTTADLRGIDNVGNGVVWASGTGGTVLRSVDGGHVWLHCAVPPGAETLDFRGVQGFDGKTAIVMSSGKGDLSRLYKTSDGCKNWKLVFTNPDKDGFWDGITAHKAGPLDAPTCPSSTAAITGTILGDPVVHHSNPLDRTTHPSFYLATFTLGSSCSKDVLRASASAIFSGPGEAAFAASNSVLYQLGSSVFWLATDREIIQYEIVFSAPHHYSAESICGIDIPFHRATPSQGVFSFAIRPNSIEMPKARKFTSGPFCLKADVVAVGGDYTLPDERSTTAAFTDGGKKFNLAKTMPHGYRSAVAYDEAAKMWITVGPNGTDVSTDDGKNWRALKPANNDAPDADKEWNALSLPFVVGPHGRIGRLRSSALRAAK